MQLGIIYFWKMQIESKSNVQLMITGLLDFIKKPIVYTDIVDVLQIRVKDIYLSILLIFLTKNNIIYKNFGLKVCAVTIIQ